MQKIRNINYRKLSKCLLENRLSRCVPVVSFEVTFNFGGLGNEILGSVTSDSCPSLESLSLLPT